MARHTLETNESVSSFKSHFYYYSRLWDGHGCTDHTKSLECKPLLLVSCIEHASNVWLQQSQLMETISTCRKHLNLLLANGEKLNSVNEGYIMYIYI